MTSVLIERGEMERALNAAPAVILLDGLAGAESLTLAGIDVWRAREREGGFLLQRQGQPAPADPAPLPLAMPGLLAIVAPAPEAAAKLLDWSDRASSIRPPVIAASHAEAVPAQLSALLATQLDEARAQLGDLHRALAVTRLDYEESRVAMAAVLRTLGHRPPAALRQALSTAPAPAGLLSRPAGAHFHLRQMLGLPVKEIAALALHLGTAACGGGTILRIRLIAAESGRIVGSWLLRGDELEEGWLTLDLPAPAAALRESGVVEVEANLSGEDRLALSLTEMTVSPDIALNVLAGQADATDRALALKVWTAETAGRFVLARHWNWDENGLTLPEDGVPHLLPSADWSRATLIEGKAKSVGLGSEVPRPIAVLDGNSRTLIGLPPIRAAGMDVVRIDLALLTGIPGLTRAAVWLRDAAALDSLNDPVAENAARWSGWRDFDAANGQCTITLAIPLLVAEALQIVVGVSMPSTEAKQPCAVEIKSAAALRASGTALRLHAPRRKAAVAAAELSQPEPSCRFDSLQLNQRLVTPTGYQHLDITVRGLATAYETWREIRFKFSLQAGKPGIEFRRGKGWPEVFETWPGTLSDKFGPFFRFNIADMAGQLAPIKGTRDGRLIDGVLRILSKLIEALPKAEIGTGEELERWTAAAERLASSAVETEKARDASELQLL